MTVQKDSIVTLHYTLKDDSGSVLDSSDPDQPLAYLHGHGNLIPGLERELEGKSAGDQLSVTVAPAEAYGEHDQSLVQRVPRRTLSGVGQVRPGMRLTTQTGQGPRSVTVTQVQGDLVTLDANHPLAGKTLFFAIHITDVREATQEELAHGHAHGPDGHHHHG